MFTENSQPQIEIVYPEKKRFIRSKRTNIYPTWIMKQKNPVDSFDIFVNNTYLGNTRTHHLTSHSVFDRSDSVSKTNQRLLETQHTHKMIKRFQMDIFKTKNRVKLFYLFDSFAYFCFWFLLIISFLWVVLQFLCKDLFLYIKLHFIKTSGPILY